MTDDDARTAARAAYGSDDIEVDEDAKVSHGEGEEGVWVAAWVWVGPEEVST